MSQDITKIKKEMETRLTELRLKRKSIIIQFKKRIEKAKMDQIKDSILDK